MAISRFSRGAWPHHRCRAGDYAAMNALGEPAAP